MTEAYLTFLEFEAKVRDRVPVDIEQFRKIARILNKAAVWDVLSRAEKDGTEKQMSAMENAAMNFIRAARGDNKVDDMKRWQAVLRIMTKMIHEQPYIEAATRVLSELLVNTAPFDDEDVTRIRTQAHALVHGVDRQRALDTLTLRPKGPALRF